MRTPRARDTDPAEASSSPTRIRSRVVLPTPFGPTSPMRAPLLMVNVRLANRSNAPNDLVREETVMRDMIDFRPPNYKAPPVLRTPSPNSKNLGREREGLFLFFITCLMKMPGLFLPQFQ